MASQYQLSAISKQFQSRVAIAEVICDTEEQARDYFEQRCPDAFSREPKITKLWDGEEVAAKRAAAARLAQETGLPVAYSSHGGICLSRGPLVRTDIEPTAEAVAAAWASMGASVWCQADRSTSATGKPYFESED